MRRHAFTLFEIAIALGLVSVAVVSVLVLFPAGIKAQQHARFRVLASAKMLELVDLFNTANDGNPSMDHEGPEPWDVPIAYRSRAFDLESLVPSHRSGVAPLPLAIARRLDSEGDEIARILDQGGYLYYAQPHLTGDFDERALPNAPDSEAQKLVFAVTGYAQENGLYALPWKSWPYYAPYPSPPYHVHHAGGFLPAPPDDATKTGVCEHANMEIYLWEATQDPDVQIVYWWPQDIATVGGDRTRIYGYLPYAYPGTGTTWQLPGGNERGDPTKEGAIRYLQAALRYCDKKGLGAEFYAPTGPLTPSTDAAAAATQVRALRFLSHAANCLTRWYSKAELDAGVVIPPAAIAGADSPTATYTHAMLVQLHDNALRLCDDYSASFPYDWGSPRPIERAIMTDHPLLQWDTFGPLHAGNVFCTGHPARQWLPIAGSPVTGIGRSISYPGQPLEGIWGDNARFSLAAPFAAEERCRQVAFWAVDWQAFEDFETAPSAPVDASRYVMGAPEVGKNDDIWWMMGWPLEWVDGEIWNYRNPEKAYLFFDPAAAAARTGDDVSAWILGVSGDTQDKGYGDPADPKSPQAVFSGLLGADRNFNRRIDRGPLPASTRLRAVPVARFNYYDPRVHLCLR